MGPRRRPRHRSRRTGRRRPRTRASRRCGSRTGPACRAGCSGSPGRHGPALRRSSRTRRGPASRRAPCSRRRTGDPAGSGGNARPSRPCSPPAVTRPAISRNGWRPASRRERCGCGLPARRRTGRPAPMAATSTSSGDVRPSTTGSRASPTLAPAVCADGLADGTPDGAAADGLTVAPSRMASRQPASATPDVGPGWPHATATCRRRERDRRRGGTCATGYPATRRRPRWTPGSWMKSRPRGRLRPPVRGVPDGPGPVRRAVRHRGRRGRPAVAPHRGRALCVCRVGRPITVGDEDRAVVPARWCSSRPGSRIASTTSPSGWSSSSRSVRRKARGRRREGADRRPGGLDSRRHAVRRDRRDRRAQLDGELRSASDVVMAEEDEDIEAGVQERRRGERPRQRARSRRSRGGAAAGRGTGRSDGASAVSDRRAGRWHTAPHRPSRSASMVSSTCQPGSWNSRVSGRSRGHAARSAASFGSSRLTFAGTRNRTLPSRGPNARYGSVSQGRPRSGEPPNARNEPPRCALTMNRKDSGVAASQLATLAADGCW